MLPPRGLNPRERGSSCGQVGFPRGTPVSFRRSKHDAALRCRRGGARSYRRTKTITRRPAARFANVSRLRGRGAPWLISLGSGRARDHALCCWLSPPRLAHALQAAASVHRLAVGEHGILHTISSACSSSARKELSRRKRCLDLRRALPRRLYREGVFGEGLAEPRVQITRKLIDQRITPSPL